MPRVHESIDIAAPIAAVFTALTDPKRATEWNMNVIEVRDVSDYPVQEGTTWQQVTVVLDQPVNLQCRVVRLRPPNEGVLEISGGQRGRISTRCETVGEMTRVTVELDFVPPGGMLGRMAGGLIGPIIKRELKQTMQRQREILEGEAGGADGSRASQ